MITISMIGNLAADAKLSESNGRSFITFRVADTRKWTDAQNVPHEVTQWASCIMSVSGPTPLLEYLKKGTKIFVSGACDIEIYSSPKLRQMVGRYNVNVQHVELCGGMRDEVPSKLVTPAGEIVDIYKAYYMQPELAKQLEVKELYPARGEGRYLVNEYGFVVPDAQATNTPQDNSGQDEQQS